MRGGVYDGLAAPLTPTTSCRGVSVEMAEWREALVRHFEVSRRRTSTMAMGRCSPLFFREARRVALQRWGRTEGGALPAARRLMRQVREERAWVARSGEGHTTASRRWLGRRPDGPGAGAFGKDLTALRMAGSESEAGEGTGPGGT